MPAFHQMGHDSENLLWTEELAQYRGAILSLSIMIGPRSRLKSSGDAGRTVLKPCSTRSYTYPTRSAAACVNGPIFPTTWTPLISILMGGGTGFWKHS